MKENDIGQLITALSNKELIIRVDLNKSLKVSKFKVGSLEMKGELGISFRDIVDESNLNENVENNELEEKIKEISEENEEELENESEEEPSSVKIESL
jgi:hypothetical protein